MYPRSVRSMDPPMDPPDPPERDDNESPPGDWLEDFLSYYPVSTSDHELNRTPSETSGARKDPARHEDRHRRDE
jgi:hypothetical protein